MQRTFISNLLVFLLVFTAVPVLAAISDITVDPLTIDTVEILQNDLATISFTLTNDHLTDTIMLSTSIDDVEDDDGDSLTFILDDTITLDPLETQTFDLTIDVPKTMDIDTYDTTLTFTNDLTLETETIDFAIEVTPGVCDFGPAGSALKIDIKEPDGGDDFNPGDEMRIEVEVDNDGSDDLRVQVEAFLYDESGIIESSASKDVDIEEDEDEKFVFFMTIPVLNEAIDDDETFELFVKAFDDDDEDQECVQDKVSVDIELEKHDILIAESTRFLPSVVACGSEATLLVDVINVGKKDENVQIKVESTALDIYEVSDTFELEDFNADEDRNEGGRTFYLSIPEGVAEGDYGVSIKALFSGETAQSNEILQVTSCGVPSSSLSTSIPASMKVQSETLLSVNQGTVETVHVVVTNQDSQERMFIVRVADVGEFGESTATTVVVGAGQSTNVFLPLTVLETVDAGTYSAVVELSDGVQRLAAETLTVVVGTVEASEEGFLKDLSSRDLVILNIIAIVFVLIVIMLLRTI